MNTDTLIRTARASDAQTIADFNIAMALETEHLRLDPPTVLAGVRAALANPALSNYFVIEINGALAAQLMIAHEWSDWRNGDIWWIESVYVHPTHRRKGLFRALYEHTKREAKKQKAVGLRLYVERENQNAQQTYTSLGMDLTHYLVMEEMWKK
jgi:GNAT superfamily N-acetyltransferase